MTISSVNLTARNNSHTQKNITTQKSNMTQKDSLGKNSMIKDSVVQQDNKTEENVKDSGTEKGSLIEDSMAEDHSTSLRDMNANSTSSPRPAPRVARYRSSKITDGNDDANNNGNDDWQYTEEPHASRRMEILRRHPEIKQLMGPDPNLTYIVTGVVAAQVFLCWLLQDASWPAIFVLAYALGATLNQTLCLSLHELSHNLAFGNARGWMNRVLGIWTNLPLALPMAITFRKYHADHHRYLGEGIVDADTPTQFETRFFRHPLTKLVWISLHPVFYGLRPLFKNPKPLSAWEATNALCQIVFDGVVLHVFGVKAVVYLLSGTYFGLSLHPLASHYFSEHYFFADGRPTHSYYGPLNWVLLNSGYHTEHHDFPYVPYSRLPEVKRLAPEFYDHLPQHTSWVKVMWDFIFDPTVNPHASTKGI